MNVNHTRDSETRLALEKTLNTLEQLAELKEAYDKQEKTTNSGIAMLELKLKDLKQQRSRIVENNRSTSQSITQMEAVVQNLRSALSLMRRIPDEILLLVFSLICQDVPRFTQPPVPIVLSGVCSRWRSILKSNSSLWGAVRIRMDLIVSSYRTEKGTQTIKHMLEHSQGPQRSLYLDDWTPDRHTSLENLLVCDKAPFQKIVINPVDLKAARNAWNIENCRATELHLHIPEVISYNPISYEKILPIMRYSSILLICGQPPDLGGLPWINLRSLTLTRRPFSLNHLHIYCRLGRQKFVDILRAAPHLMELNMNILPVNGDVTLPEIPFFLSHSKLEVLRLQMEHFAANGMPFGMHLDAPALREVTLYTMKRLETVNESSFFGSWDAPTHLILPPFEDYDVANAAELVRCYPCVETLEVYGKNIDTLFIFMHNLLNRIPPETDSLPLPKLNTLHITDSDLRGETLLEFLDARLRHVRSGTHGMRALVEIVMYETPGVTPGDWARVNERLEEGRALNERFGNTVSSRNQHEQLGAQTVMGLAT